MMVLKKCSMLLTQSTALKNTLIHHLTHDGLVCCVWFTFITAPSRRSSLLPTPPSRLAGWMAPEDR